MLSRYSREIFSSAPGQAIIMKISANRKGKLNFTTWFERPGDAEELFSKRQPVVDDRFCTTRGENTFCIGCKYSKHRGAYHCGRRKITVKGGRRSNYPDFGKNKLLGRKRELRKSCGYPNLAQTDSAIKNRSALLITGNYSTELILR